MQIGVTTFSQEHESIVTVKSNNNSNLGISLFGESSNDVSIQTNNSQIDINYKSIGNEHIYLLLKRESLDNIGFEVGWTSPITYLKSGKQSIGLRCIEETGLSILGTKPGGDEIEIKISIDDNEFLNYNWNDVDTGELENKYLHVHLESISFVNNIKLSIREKWIFDTGAGGYSLLQVEALNETQVEDIVLNREVVVQSGRYRLEGTLSRTPSNQK
ncbi:MAG: hypothetical protein IPJ00_16780 [Saprospirales bacterium]|nr:hypothetical protein [Saprospirales bacterium]